MPSGPSKRRMSRSFILPKTWSVNWPPATWRTCSSTSSSACGALPIEKLRREPSFSRNSRYCPARNCSRSLAGSLSCSIMTSSVDAPQRLHAAGQRLDLDVLRRADGARLDHHVAERLRLAEKRLALRLLLVGERLLLVDAVVDLALEQLALAAAAGAVAAAVGQHEVLAQRGGQDRLAFLDLEFVPARLQGDFAHVYNRCMKRLLVVGFGDIARRAAPLLASRFEILRAARRDGFDLDRPETLVLGRVDALLHLAPPPGEGDQRYANRQPACRARKGPHSTERGSSTSARAASTATAAARASTSRGRSRRRPRARAAAPTPSAALHYGAARTARG